MWKRYLLVLVVLAQSPSLVDLFNRLQGDVDQIRAAVITPAARYTAITDRLVRPKPAPLPTLGPAGSFYLDPTFGARVWRATDAKTSNGSALRVASNTSLASWNTNGSVFFVMNEGGAAVFFAFSPTGGPAKISSTIASQIEPSFSYVDMAIVYGVAGHKIKKWNIITEAPPIDVLDLDTLGLHLGADTYVGGLVTSDNDDYVTFFGGTGQDHHFYVRHSNGKLLDTRPLGFFVHSAILERGGPNVIVFPAVDPNTGKLPGCPGPTCIAQIQIWNTSTGIVTPVSVANGGHASVGYGDLINADIVPGTPWDPLQWVTRQLSTPTVVSNLINPLLPARPMALYPQGGLSDHQNYRHAKPGVTVPIVSSVYRWDGYAGPWRAWDDEIIGIDPNGTVYRFAHHYSIATTFWDQPIVSVRPQGDWAIVTTNYGQTLGGRQDVLVVQLR